MTSSSTILLCFKTEVNISIVLVCQNLVYLCHVPLVRLYLSVGNCSRISLSLSTVIDTNILPVPYETFTNFVQTWWSGIPVVKIICVRLII